MADQTTRGLAVAREAVNHSNGGGVKRTFDNGVSQYTGTVHPNREDYENRPVPEVDVSKQHPDVKTFVKKYKKKAESEKKIKSGKEQVEDRQSRDYWQEKNEFRAEQEREGKQETKREKEHERQKELIRERKQPASRPAPNRTSVQVSPYGGRQGGAFNGFGMSIFGGGADLGRNYSSPFRDVGLGAGMARGGGRFGDGMFSVRAMGLAKSAAYSDPFRNASLASFGAAQGFGSIGMGKRKSPFAGLAPHVASGTVKQHPLMSHSLLPKQHLLAGSLTHHPLQSHSLLHNSAKVFHSSTSLLTGTKSGNLFSVSTFGKPTPATRKRTAPKKKAPARKRGQPKIYGNSAAVRQKTHVQVNGKRVPVSRLPPRRKR